MKIKLKKSEVPVTELNTTVIQKNYIQLIWKIFLSAVLITGTLTSIRATWGSLTPSDGAVTFVVGIALVCCAVSELMKDKIQFSWLFMLIPWPLLLIMRGPVSCWTGARAWINVLLARWNAINQGGAPLFSIQVDQSDVLAFLLLMTLIITEITWILVKGHHLILLYFFCIFWLGLQLLCSVLNPISCGVMFSGIAGLWITGKNMQINKRKAAWSVIILAVMCFMGYMMPTAEITAVDDIRDDVENQIHEMRYGEDTLPEGNLYNAAMLQADNSEMLKLRTEQIKNIYLKGFVGASYSDGVWNPLPGAAYGEKYAGILSWLNEQGFDPLTQTSQYYKLEASDDVQKNRLNIQVTGGSRYYVYTPATLENLINPKMSEKRDTRLMSDGLVGTRSYTMDELSGSRPAELTVTADWVSNPETDEQKAYLEAESTYRNFVYDRYMSVDKDTTELMQEMFWKDYESESDGIYSAVCQVRDVLKNTVEYTENPDSIPEDKDPVIYFLTESKKGNSMLYASAAVDALRVHGIPARYVEGYYVPSADIEKNAGSAVSLTGQNAHAWAEAYFDGIGWLPLDVSPGYYYDAITLQKMVSLPDTVQKNAVLKDNARGSEASTGLEGVQKKKLRDKILPTVYDTAAICLGVVAILLMLLILAAVLAEILRIICIWQGEKRERHDSPRERTLRISRKIYSYLRLIGIEARLGWNTQETDALLTKRFEAVEPGEYSRVCALIEKVIYGEMELEPYEERTLQNFLGKLISDSQKMGWKIWLKRRYVYVWKNRK